ncbi:MAG TPA: hypothetical protein DCW87_10275 [Comamonadaceae bacterium]|nr:hypothetical protein [Comamonadaceae bacterium]
MCLANFLLLLPHTVQAAPAVALHYGQGIPLSEFRTFDIVVVEPGHGHDPVKHRAGGSGGELYAYVSVAEVQPSRPYYADIPAAWQMARNGHWNSVVLDQTPQAWPDFFANRVVAPLWERGYKGFFLDTLDSYRLAERFDEKAQQDGLVRVIETLHRRFPGIRLILNRGFEIVPRVKGKIEMVAAESLYRGWNAGTQRYEEVKAEDSAWILAQLRTIQERDRLPVLAIDYAPPHDRALARETARRIQAQGIIPWVGDSQLHTLGVGSIEVVPRRILMVYNGAEAVALNYANPHRYLQMPLNHMGYVVDYADMREALPEGIYGDRYAGIASWFSGFVPTQKSKELSRWLLARAAEGMPLAIVDDFGFQPDRAWAAQLGLQTSNVEPQGALRIVRQHAMMGFETATPVPHRDYTPVRLTGTMAAQATPLVELQDARGQAFVGGALMPWGGFALDPFVMTELPGLEQKRWVLDPFAFLTQALRLQPMPVPDVTTENGRRLLMAHVDGDGFPSRAELPGSPFASEVLLKEVFEKYRIPQTMSVIEAEVAPHGIYPKESAQLEEIARRMFRLPHIEIASHSYSHPFLWDRSARHGVFLEETQKDYHLDLPGYTFNLEREIVGSVDYIRQRLAPVDKPVSTMLWTGDTAPSAEALAITSRAGLLNMNGGDTFISRSHPSLTAVRSPGIHKGGYLQVFAPITNENIYTNLWQGPFYGFERAIETFEMTDSPRRIKPVDIYYHTYSASKRAGLNALHKVYRWALAQPLHPVFTSEYIRKVQDYYDYTIARDGQGWRVRGTGELRTLRLPAHWGVPALADSQNVAGYRKGEEGTYLHLTGGSAWFRTQEPTAAPQRSYLHEANARIQAWRTSADGTRTEFTLQGHVPLQWSLALASRQCQVRAHGRVLPPVRADASARAGIQTFQLPDASAHIQILCPAA